MAQNPSKRGPEGRNSQLVLGLDDALRGKVGRGAGVVHERAEAGGKRLVRLQGQGLVRVAAVLVKDGAKLLHDVEPALEQGLHVGRNAVGRAVDEDLRASLEAVGVQTSRMGWRGAGVGYHLKVDELSTLQAPEPHVQQRLT